jgi:hypothetical protein
MRYYNRAATAAADNIHSLRCCRNLQEDEEIARAAQALMVHHPVKAEPQQMVEHLDIYTGALGSTADSRLNSPHSSSSPGALEGFEAEHLAAQRRPRSRSEESWHSDCSSDYSPVQERPLRSTRKRKLKANVAAALAAGSQGSDGESQYEEGSVGGENYVPPNARRARSKRLGARSRFTNEQNALMKSHLATMMKRRDFYLE